MFEIRVENPDMQDLRAQEKIRFVVKYVRIKMTELNFSHGDSHVLRNDHKWRSYKHIVLP